ncbi:YraN family protein [Aquabacterium sp.]|uniref:YraN family protein n=1 Tax=Aquabacterium sp. TaxID=1872578 RepID=UPI002BE8BEDF|nr:YraN family protein [Aquabacterium sp.]HSW03747.1 YraN family protein [Aquabacterium sp.]
MVTSGGQSRRVGGKRATQTSRQLTGDDAEQRALVHLQRQGLRLVCRNYRLAGGPFARGAEIDLILWDTDGTLVFVEVRSRASGSAGGAAASVTGAKQRRIVRAAQHYLLQLAQLPPCRFDVVAIDGDALQWIRAAFDSA